ncbi:MAG: efflux RND transporter periplasmic adaptor subunit [Cocleimonas sp.]|nr:efflux RND transporter periplasmic adaptor subunit [Cocleimonas sp.]
MKIVTIKFKALIWGFLISLGLVFPIVASAANFVTVQSSASNSRTVLGSTVVPYKTVTLTAQFPGRIMSIGGEAGAKFPAGSLLVKINDDALKAKKGMVEAQLQSAQAALKNSQLQYNREMISPRSKNVGAMPGMGMPSMMDIYFTRPFADAMGTTDTGYNRYTDLMNSATTVTQARTQVMQAMSQLNEITANLKNANSVSPFEGMILKKMVEVGDTVQPGQPLLEFGFIKYLRTKADVPEVLVGSLKKGMIIPVKIGGRKSQARVAQIYPVADAARHTVVVKFDLKTGINASPGMYAELFLPDSGGIGKAIITIPKTALIKGRSLPSVLVLDEAKGVTKLRLLRLGVDQGNSTVQVITGIKIGEKVVDNPPPGALSGWMPQTSVAKQ